MLISVYKIDNYGCATCIKNDMRKMIYGKEGPMSEDA